MNFPQLPKLRLRKPRLKPLAETEELVNAEVAAEAYTVEKKNASVNSRNTFVTLGDGTYYIDGDGNELKVTFLTVDGKEYCTYGNGYIKNKWVPTDVGLCFFGADGSKQTGVIYFNGNYYPVNSDGALTINSWMTVNGNKYYTDSQGHAVTGFKDIGVETRSKRYCFNKNYTLRKNNWVQIDSKLYYAGKDGILVTGWQTINGRRFHFDSNGVLIK